MLNKDDFNTILLNSATRDGDTIEKCYEKCEGKDWINKIDKI